MTDYTGFSRRRVLQTGAAFAGAWVSGATQLFAAGSDKVTLIIASPATLVVWSVTYLAEDLGYYKDEGIVVERMGLGGGPAAMTALLSGEGLAGCSAPGEGLTANARGQRIKVLESYTRTDPYTLCVSAAFAKEIGITAESSLDDRKAALVALKGKRLGITAPGSNTDLVVRMSLKQLGLDPDRDVTIVPTGSLVNVMSALSQGAIEGGALLSPFPEQAGLEFGAVPMLSTAAGDIPQAARLQGQVLQTRPQVLEKNRDLLAAFVRADMRAHKFLIEDPDGARDTLKRTRFSNIPDAIWPDVWSRALPIFGSPYVTRDSLSAWLETGTIGGAPDPQTFPYDEIIDMSLVNEGLQKAGWTPAAG